MTIDTSVLRGAIDYPPFEKYGVKVFVGGCVERGVGSSFRHSAHSHNSHSDPFFGWVCVRSHRRLYVLNTDRPSQLMLHEYAHILVPNRGHTDAWREMARSLGYRLLAHEKKQTRVSRRSSVHPSRDTQTTSTTRPGTSKEQ